MSGQVANWIANLLSDRKQIVAVSGRMSCWEDVSSGMLGLGKNNENRDYGMQGVILECVTQEKDLGVVIDMGDKQAAQCQAAICRANRVLGCIRRGISYKSKEVVTLYRNLVRATSRILCAVLVTTVQEGHRCHREGSAQGY